MLVLTRRVGETIVIEGGIEVTVVAAHGDRVRLAIKAPDSIRVDRLEVHQRRSGFDRVDVVNRVEACHAS